MAEPAAVSPPAPRRRGLDAAKDRAMLDAAVAELQERGYGRLTTAAVAKRAGVSTATLYRRYRSKDDLVASATLAWTCDEIPDRDTGTLPGDLEALLHDKAATFDGPGGRLLRALTAEAAHNDTLARVLIDAIVAPIGDRVAAVLGRAAQRGEIPAGQDPAIITDLIIGPIISRVFLTRPDTTAVPVAALVDHLVPYLLRAIGAAAPNHN